MADDRQSPNQTGGSNRDARDATSLGQGAKQPENSPVAGPNSAQPPENDTNINRILNNLGTYTNERNQGFNAKGVERISLAGFITILIEIVFIYKICQIL